MKKAFLPVFLLSAACVSAAQLMAAPNGAGYYDTSEFLMGSISVNIVFPESNGSIQPNTETWTEFRKSQVVDQIQQAMNWWAAREARAKLSFVYPTPVTVATGYEPITCNVSTAAPCGEREWIGQVMSNLGYATGDYWERVYAYNNAMRTANGTDWAITIFVADSNNDANGEFADGMFAYAYLGGPFMVMTYDNGGYWISNMNAVAAHELGHLFYALDEYAASGCTTSERAGYMNIQNVNCENTPITNVGCIMRGDTPPYTTPAICDATKQMLGWWDSADADTAFDIIGFTPVTELTAYSPDPTSVSAPTYNGIARSTAAYANSNPYTDDTNHYWYTSDRNNMSLLKITGVEYNIDGGGWLAATATDGVFGQSIESFTFTTASLPDAAYTFRARAKNIFNVYDPAPPSDALTINTLLPADITYVNDGTGGDIKYVSSLNTLSANWGASSHASGINRYEYAIGIAPEGATIQPWTSTLLARSVTATGLPLVENTTYYFSARAFSNSGFPSGASVSNGQLVDTTSPTAKVEISSPLPAKTGPLTLKLIVTELNGFSTNGSPALSFTPSGSSSQTVTLSYLLPSTWTGAAFIESFYSTGTAAFSFRAVDPAGNVGTLITIGSTFTINTAIDGATGGTVVNIDNSAVIVPAGAYAGALVLNISTVAASRLSHANSFASNSAPLMASDLTREFTARTPAGAPVTSFGAPVTIRLCYPDANNDGRIDGDSVSEDLARLYWLDESASRWVQLPVRPEMGGNCISAPTTHFSVYTIRTMDSSQFGMGNLKAFPSPCYFDRAPGILTIRGIPPDAQKTEIYIYNTAGELVRELKRGDGIDDFNEGVWDGRQKGGSKAASGLYIYLAKTANFGNGTGKFYIFW